MVIELKEISNFFLLRMDIYKLVRKISTVGVLVYISSHWSSSCSDFFWLLGTSLRFLDPLDALEPGFGLPASLFVWSRDVAGHWIYDSVSVLRFDNITIWKFDLHAAVSWGDTLESASSNVRKFKGTDSVGKFIRKKSIFFCILLWVMYRLLLNTWSQPNRQPPRIYDLRIWKKELRF